MLVCTFGAEKNWLSFGPTNFEAPEVENILRRLSPDGGTEKIYVVPPSVRRLYFVCLILDARMCFAAKN